MSLMTTCCISHKNVNFDRINSMGRYWKLLCKTYVYLILNKWVNGTVSGASGLCRTQKERRRKKTLLGHRGASHPHKIVKPRLAP